MTTLSTPTSTADLATLPRGMTPKQHAEIKDTAQQFEDFFVYQMLELMSPEPDEDNVMGGGFGEQMYRKQLNEYLAEDIGATGGLGVADAVERQLLRLQTEAHIRKTSASAAYQNANTTQSQPGQTLNTIQ